MKNKLLLEFPEILETENLVIRKYRKGDGKDNYDLFERNNNRELLKEFVDEATDITSEEDSEIKIRGHAAEWEARTRFVMGVWLKEKNCTLVRYGLSRRNGKSHHSNLVIS